MPCAGRLSPSPCIALALAVFASSASAALTPFGLHERVRLRRDGGDRIRRRLPQRRLRPGEQTGDGRDGKRRSTASPSTPPAATPRSAASSRSRHRSAASAKRRSPAGPGPPQASSTPPRNRAATSPGPRRAPKPVNSAPGARSAASRWTTPARSGRATTVTTRSRSTRRAAPIRRSLRSAPPGSAGSAS